MKTKLLTARKILIIGESGRGKTTFANKLSEKLKIPFYSTDDFFWKTKFSEPHDKQVSIKNIEKVYLSDSWIVEGSSTHLFKPGLEKADLIINLIFKNVFEQWWSLIKRNQKRKDEKLLAHLMYVTQKRFGIGNSKEKLKKELLKLHTNKIIIIDSYKMMNEFIDDK